MYAPEFEYHRAATVAEAIQLLSSNEDAKLIAGGHSLLPLLKLRLARPSVLVDIGRISELKGITIRDGTVRIGALTTHWEISSSHDLEHACGIMAEAAGGIGDTQVRNRGTIGGNVVHADPASDWPTVLTVLANRNRAKETWCNGANVPNGRRGGTPRVSPTGYRVRNNWISTTPWSSTDTTIGAEGDSTP